MKASVFGKILCKLNELALFCVVIFVHCLTLFATYSRLYLFFGNDYESSNWLEKTQRSFGNSSNFLFC